MPYRDRHFEEYFRVLLRHLSPEELDRLLTILGKWCTIEEFESLLAHAGTPQEVEKLIDALKDRSKDWAWAATTKQKVWLAVKVITATGVLFITSWTVWQMIVERWSK